MAPTVLVSGDGHGFMNRYRTLTLKEIHKLPKLVLIVFKKCAKAGHVSWCDICQCEFSYLSNLSNFSMNGMNRSLRLVI